MFQNLRLRKPLESIIFNLIEKRTKLFETCSGDRIKSTLFLASARVSSMLLIILLLGIMKLDSLFVAELLKTPQNIREHRMIELILGFNHA
jgi:hypothetical protein